MVTKPFYEHKTILFKIYYTRISPLKCVCVAFHVIPKIYIIINIYISVTYTSYIQYQETKYTGPLSLQSLGLLLFKIARQRFHSVCEGPDLSSKPFCSDWTERGHLVQLHLFLMPHMEAALLLNQTQVSGSGEAPIWDQKNLDVHVNGETLCSKSHWEIFFKKVSLNMPVEGILWAVRHNAWIFCIQNEFTQRQAGKRQKAWSAPKKVGRGDASYWDFKTLSAFRTPSTEGRHLRT